MANYYCFMAGLPTVKLTDAQPQQSLLQLKEELADVLEPQDARLMQRYFMRFDCENLATLLADEAAEIDQRGNYDREALSLLIEEARQTDSAVKGFPAFMADFVRDYDAHAGQTNWFARDAALLAYYNYARECPNAMMADWYSLNFNILNILTALIARRQGWALENYVQGDGPVVEALLKQSTQADFGLNGELDYMKDLMQAADTTDPVEKERQIDGLRWNWLEDKTFFEPFDITALFAYVVRNEILERWALLDPEQGRERFTQIIENLRGEAKVPEEFLR
ncbi:MAG: DUF2764 family protein [Bacteroidaceae bacterium]|nr:DUF2764 family protein [Bacteroidaceae bacterium]